MSKREIDLAAAVIHEQTCKDNSHDDYPWDEWPCVQLAKAVLQRVEPMRPADLKVSDVSGHEYDRGDFS